MERLSRAEVAARAGVDKEFVARLAELRILEAPDEEDSLRASDVYRTRLMRACLRAGLPIEGIAAALADGRISLAFMDQPSYRWARQSSTTYRELAASSGVRVELLLAADEALGSPRCAPDDPVREDLVAMIPLMQLATGGLGLDDAILLRLIRVYVDSIRRITEAEGFVWHNHVEMPLIQTGLTAAQVSERTMEFSTATTPLQEEAILAIYRRQQERVWTEDTLEHLEVALEEMGLRQRTERSSAMAFLDITGYTRLTEERGDRAAAELAAALADVVQRHALERGGRPVKWLGDGVMVYFDDPASAVVATVDIVREVPKAGLPPAHAGVASGPIVVQDGDYFGRTVNMASRVAAHAGAGQALVTDDVTKSVTGAEVTFREIGLVELKGVPRPVRLHEAVPPPG